LALKKKEKRKICLISAKLQTTKSSKFSEDVASQKPFSTKILLLGGGQQQNSDSVAALPMSSRRTLRASCTARLWRESSFSGIREELGLPISSSLSIPQKRAHGCILCSDDPFPSTPIKFLTHIR
jgi:hypothetical protein